MQYCAFNGRKTRKQLMGKADQSEIINQSTNSKKERENETLENRRILGFGEIEKETLEWEWDWRWWSKEGASETREEETDAEAAGTEIAIVSRIGFLLLTEIERERQREFGGGDLFFFFFFFLKLAWETYRRELSLVRNRWFRRRRRQLINPIDDFYAANPSDCPGFLLPSHLSSL